MLAGIIGLVSLVFSIYCIYDLWTNQNKETGTKVLWTVLLLLFGLISSLIYWFAIRKK